MKIKLLITFLIAFCININAQTIIYNDDFTAGAAGWQLGQGGNFDTWIVNNTYNCIDPTPDQGGGNYMHVYDDLDGEYCAVGVFLGSGSGGLVYSTMTSGVSTVGNSSDTVQFDWLCDGQTGSILPSYGSVDYSTDSGITWVNIPSPIARYSGVSTWTHQIITSAMVPAMLNAADFRIRFGFTNSGYGTNPAFAIDNIRITGRSATIGISNVNSFTIFSAYPNPATDKLTVSLSYTKPQATLFILRNIVGETVYTSSEEPQNSSFSKVIDMQNFAAGIYFLEAKTTEGSSIIKITH